MAKWLVNRIVELKKFSGKGGWTYIHLPEISPDKNMPFGWVIVSGFVDDFELIKYKLLPLGNGQLFLPVKSVIRKKIKKQEGDKVHLKLQIDKSTLKIPEEIILCFENEPKKAFTNFINLSEINQKRYLDWIYSAKTEETKTQRIIKLLDDMSDIKNLMNKSLQVTMCISNSGLKS